jgi:site-specific DNA-methyltransferase (adenine-specific)
MIAVTDKIRAYNMDCMEFMKGVPDKYYDLAICDPPYGIGVNKMTLGNGKKKIYRGKSDWDKYAPNADYFDMLKRKSKNMIIWGANHFIDNIPFNVNSPCWLFWDKGNGDNDFADGELAWTSFNGAMRKITKSWVGANAKDEAERIHPTQKPIYVYKYCLDKYASPNDRILDTHGGSMSIAIACHDYGFELDIMELDKEYFDKGVDRVRNHVAQTKLF